MTKKILVLPGDGIGPEIVAEARKVLDKANIQFELGLEFEEGLLGGCSIDAFGVPLSDETLARAAAADVGLCDHRKAQTIAGGQGLAGVIDHPRLGVADAQPFHQQQLACFGDF